jgi:hypothetical protein
MKTQTNPSAADTAQHTPEPWAIHVTRSGETSGIIQANDGLTHVCDTFDAAWHNAIARGQTEPATRFLAQSQTNARRIITCVNACQGIANPGETIPALVAALKGAESALFAALAVRCPGLDLEGVAKRHAATVAALAQLDSIRQP